MKEHSKREKRKHPFHAASQVSRAMQEKGDTKNGICFGISTFGKSAPYKDVYKYFGLEKENIVNKIKKLIKSKS